MSGTGLQMRVGLPLTGGRMVASAKAKGYPVLFSANAFARTYPKGHEREGYFAGFRLPRPGAFDGMDAALDSAGFVVASQHKFYRWSVEDYYDLVAAHPWTFHAAMDLCCEAEIAGDRPLRLLRIAGTARLLALCRAEAALRGLPAPMPVLQGLTPQEYALCAEWLPVIEWPNLIGIGSVCRRPVYGPTGILAILDAVDKILPTHTRCHLFGVKSDAMSLLAKHPRVASCDSMAYEYQARAERRTGRDMDFRLGHMDRWMARQQLAIAAPPAGAALQRSLFDPAHFGGVLSSTDEMVLEAIALRYADLVMGGNIEYEDAVWHSFKDGVETVARVRLRGISPALFEELNDEFEGLGDQLAELLEAAAA